MQCCIFFLKVNITSYIYVSQDWVFIHHNLAQSISSVTEKEVVTSSTSLKQSSNRCSREGRNPATLNWSMVHQAHCVSCLKSPGEKSNTDWGANGLQVDREKKPWHTTTTVTTADNLPACWFPVHRLSHPLILGLYLPCVWFYARTLSLALREQPSRIRNSTTSSRPYSAARWNAVLSIFERKQRNTVQERLRKQKIRSSAASNIIMPCAITQSTGRKSAALQK